MKSKKQLIFTFDYELFLGSRSGTVENCILLPTDKILNSLKKYNIDKAVFFIDTTYLLHLKKNNSSACQDDFEKISRQLIRIKNEGHYIFPHLHPHWLDAQYLPEINQWDLTALKKYSFSSITSEERESIFSESIKLLEEICGYQQELGYRAGGWCIQPFSDFKPFFIKHKILYDFSVLRGYRCISEFQNFDFRNALDQPFYSFSDDVNARQKDGEFIEIPISIFKMNLLTRLVNKIFIKILYKKGIRNYGDGLSTVSASLKESFPLNHEMASIELLTIANINTYIKLVKENDVIHFISHPKMLSAHNVDCLDMFLKNIFSKYSVNTDFKKMIHE